MNDQFNYKYTAPTEEERRVIDSIRRQYSEQKEAETKYERIKRLDTTVKNTATIVSLCLGVVGCLIFGLGLTMILEWSVWAWGIALCVVGCVPMALAYPTYKAVLSKGKRKYGEEILRLSNELLNEKE